MNVPTAVISSSNAMRARAVPRIPRCPRTRLTKPECHCPACLLEQIAAHGRPAAPAAAADERTRAAVIL